MTVLVLPVLLLLGLSSDLRLTQAADPVVKVEQGSLQGKEVQGAGGTKPYFAFRGVPFALPPVGSLRFKAPRPAKAWTGIRVADKEGSVCSQPSLQGSIIGSEDCLYLNVYTPQVTCKALLPVIVWNFGGGFTWGDGGAGWYGPDFIVNNDVVLVSANSRVGPLGFLNLETADAPGNAGMKDILQVLKWTQKNVRAFCGDPARVTLGGFSAGAMMGHTLALSPKAQGLFQRAFLMSGNALVPVAHRDDHLQVARELGAALKAADNSTASLLKAFAAATATQITGAATQLLMAQAEPFVIPRYSMSSEKAAASEADLAGSTLLTTDPETLIRTAAVKNPVPILMGNARAEALSLFLVALSTPPVGKNEATLLQRLSSRFAEIMQDFAVRVPLGAARALGVPGGFGTPAQQAQVTQLVQKTYFGGKTTFTRDQYVAMNTGAEFYGPALNYLRLCSPLPLRDRRQYGLQLFHEARHPSAFQHDDDIGYIFKPNIVDLKQNLKGTGVDAAVLRYMSTMVTDFAKGKSAGAAATCGSAGALPYVHINSASPAVASGFGSAHAVWKEVFDMRRKK